MLMRKRNALILTTAGLVVLLHYVQLGFVNQYMAIGDNRPDLLLLLTVFVGYRLGSEAGSVAGFAAGLIQDIGVDFLGLHALCKSLVGFASFYFAHRRVLLVDRYFLPLVVFSLSIGHDLLLYFLQSLGTTMDVFSLWIRLAVPNALYNTIVMYVLLMMIPQRAVEAYQGPSRYL